MEMCRLNTCFPDPYECDKFYKCAGAFWVAKRCRPGFSLNDMICDCEPNKNGATGICASLAGSVEGPSGTVIALWALFVSLLTIFMVLLFFALQCETMIFRKRSTAKEEFSHHEKRKFENNYI